MNEDKKVFLCQTHEIVIFPHIQLINMNILPQKSAPNIRFMKFEFSPVNSQALISKYFELLK